MGLGLNLIPQRDWELGDFTATKSFDPATATDEEVRQVLATLISSLGSSRLFINIGTIGVSTFTFRRPDGTSVFKRPGGVDDYIRA